MTCAGETQEILCLTNENILSCQIRCQDEQCLNKCPSTVSKVCSTALVIYDNSCKMTCNGETLITTCGST